MTENNIETVSSSEYLSSKEALQVLGTRQRNMDDLQNHGHRALRHASLYTAGVYLGVTLMLQPERVLNVIGGIEGLVTSIGLVYSLADGVTALYSPTNNPISERVYYRHGIITSQPSRADRFFGKEIYPIEHLDELRLRILKQNSKYLFLNNITI